MKYSAYSLFSYIQTHADKENREGMYLLAGSHNFLLMESVNQSLAGRSAINNCYYNVSISNK